MRTSHRLDGLGEYLAARLSRRVAEARAAGVDVISLGVGDPDLPPPAALADALDRNVRRPDAHGYPTNRGLPELRQAVSEYYGRRFRVSVDPEREVLPLLGSKEGIAHLCLTLLDPGDSALVADPGYPVYTGGPRLAGARPVSLPLRAQNGFLPDLEAAEGDAPGANLVLCGYPNNPTGAVADDAFFARLAAFGLDHDVPVCHDSAYAELWLDGPPAPSFLAAPGANDAGIEMISLSKALNVAGWRIAFAVGNADLIAALTRLKTNVDAGMFLALQRTAVTALDLVESFSAGMRDVYRRRRDLACDALRSAGIPHVPPRGGIYLWVPTPEGEGSVAFADRVFAEAGVVVGPGAAYGPAGEGYVRLSLTVPDERLDEAMARFVPLYP
jgi:LL-diaminopimelate aminotransferase